MNIICRIKVHFSDSATYRWINIAVPPFAETGLYKKNSSLWGNPMRSALNRFNLRSE